jgi:aspartate/tyrosine/aromatic aminotransferase
MATRHDWSVDDDKAALRAYLEKVPMREASIIAKSLDITVGSFRKRIGNFEYLATNGEKGLSNFAKQSERVWKEYKATGRL